MMRGRGIRHGRYIGFLTLLVLGPLLLQRMMSLDFALAAGFDIAAVAFIVTSARHWREGAPETIRDQAVRDDGGRVALLLLTIVILFSVLVIIGSLVERKAQLTPPEIAFVVGTLVIAWIFANLVYAFHYARLYYDQDPDGRDRAGLAFPGGGPPSFADFVNFSFVLGMTCQTADIGITDSVLRRAATLHGVVAFFFNLGVLALAVNVVASAL